MTCGELSEMYELYALGVLEGAEKDEIDAHLARGCETCTRRLSDAHAVNALVMATSVPELPPHSRLKRRLVASLGLTSAGWTWAAALAASCMLVVALWLADQERSRAHELARVRAEMLETAADRDRLLQAMSFLNQPETRQVGFAKSARGNVFLNPARGIVLIGSNLPKMETGKSLEMWLIPKNGSPRPAGVFAPNPDGTALHILPGPLDLSSLNSVAVTIEPESGSPAPTSPPIIAAPIAF